MTLETAAGGDAATGQSDAGSTRPADLAAEPAVAEAPTGAADGERPLVEQLPRPNLGPEPWSEGRGSREALAAGGGLALVIIAVVTVGILRGRSKRRRHVDSSPVIDAGDEPHHAAETSRDRLIRSADRIRRTLIQRFGSPWAAKTTEEIGVEPALRDWLGPERAAVVLDLLASADRAKFAEMDGPPGDDAVADHGTGWDAVAAEVGAAAREGVTSRTKGR